MTRRYIILLLAVDGLTGRLIFYHLNGIILVQLERCPSPTTKSVL